MAEFKTEQEAFWAETFGDEYVDRNQGERSIASNTAFFAQALRRTQAIGSVLELGANIGMNLQALHRLLPECELHAVEINARAVGYLRELPYVSEVTGGSILDFTASRAFDLVMIKGVLIHLAPAVLPDVYDRMFAASARYLLIAEYYHPTPVAVSYRGHQNRLFKRDFAGEMLERHPSLQLVDYGFVYRRDPKWAQDDTNWFLLEKR